MKENLKHLMPLKERYKIIGKIVTQEPLHIGSGESIKDPTEPDMPLIKLQNGQPYIPGSSLKGVIRTEFERISPELKKMVCSAEDGIPARCIPPNLCLACSLFGTQSHASKIIFRDAYLSEKEKDAEVISVRPGVQINRQSHSVEQGPFKIEFIKKEVSFDFEVILENPSDLELGMLFTTINSLSDGSIGGNISRGMGKVAINIDKILLFTPKSYAKVHPSPDKILADKSLEEFKKEKIKSINP